jgi:hypothetical protein
VYSHERKDEGWLSGEKKIMTYHFSGDGLLARLLELLDHMGLTSEILFASNENDRNVRTEMHDLGNPLKTRK